MKKIHSILFFFFMHLSCAPTYTQKAQISPEIWVRKGYTLSIVQENIKNPRMMQFNTEGVLFVSLPEAGEIKASMDKDKDGVYETVATFVKGHKKVHGMQWHDGWLWFTETGAIFKARDTNADGVADETVTVIAEGKLPKGGGHWWRPVLINNNRIYTSIGCSGNIDDETATERLKIWSFAMDGSDKKLFCGGLRNTEKLIARPGTTEVWGMDHGSDNFGEIMEKKVTTGAKPITDWNPPCEMNHYTEGSFYGHPYITGNRLPRYEYMNRNDIVEWASKTTPPAWGAGSHWAPNAMCFYDAAQFPNMKGDAFIAFHGSWNRSERGGYQVSHVMFEEGKPYGELPMVKFSTKDDIFGRPVDVIVDTEGSLLISDDWGNKIYKLTYTGGN
jgi:glucose/arabinose dehydrogenase